MRVAIFGSGYVGLVTGACLADAGNQVVCVDVDQARIDRLNAGDVPNAITIASWSWMCVRPS